MQDQPNNKEKRLVCPKGMKLHGYIKGQAALMKGKTTAEKNFFMKSMGIATHEAANRIKNANREASKARVTTATATPEPDAE